jgi:hypothetical protein
MDDEKALRVLRALTPNPGDSSHCGKRQVANTIGADTFDFPKMIVKRGREKSVSILSSRARHAINFIAFPGFRLRHRMRS